MENVTIFLETISIANPVNINSWGMLKLSSLCNGLCDTNREGFEFVTLKQVRYDYNMRACVKCNLAWVTSQKFCHCCKSKMRCNGRVKKNHE